eukprot:TRINITY_DN24126_c0_g1_i5.p1 TRINITY_DN24126_c0_g1~~TRINITY_DN24126_c0_g1_i5.p1  ORF type:complete len:417 (+),score=116.77 TRINITY_DN24126_c0_g1_i5:62-1312(+)
MSEDDIPLTSLPSKRKLPDGGGDADATTPAGKRVTRSSSRAAAAAVAAASSSSAGGVGGGKASSSASSRRSSRGSAFVARAGRRGGRSRAGRNAMSKLFASSTEEEEEEDDDEEDEMKEANAIVMGSGADDDEDGFDGNGDAAGGKNDEPVRIFDLEAIRSYVTCALCHQYLQDCNSISECLHSFCRGCLIKHFGYTYVEDDEEDENEDGENSAKNNEDGNAEKELSEIRMKGAPSTCPVCEFDLGPFPMKSVKTDPIMQNITNTLIKFLNKKDGIAEATKPENSDEKVQTDGEVQTTLVNNPFRAERKKTVFRLLPFETSKNEKDRDSWQLLPQLEKSVIETWNGVTIRQVKKYLGAKLSIDDGINELDVLCCGESLGAEYNLEFIRRTRWHDTSKCLELRYRKKVSVETPKGKK